MKVVELISILETLPPDTPVVTYDSEWGDYRHLVAAKERKADIAYAKSDPTKSPDYIVPNGDVQALYQVKVGEVMVVELIDNPGREEL